jgi:NAD(P)-dependent dehydrogenase (short-subunit alcohol dehydrogenase family)
MNRMDGKVALITGAGRGIGAASARRLAEAGAAVLVTDLNEADARLVADTIAKAGGNAVPLRLDVTSEVDWRGAVKQAEDRLGGIDVLVNNAGIAFTKPTERTGLDDWRRITAVNVDGVFLGTRACIGLLKQRASRWPGGGSIVNISSILGIVGTEAASAYSMTKGAVRLFSKSTALEFARGGYRVRVNSVHPGYIETDMGQRAMTTLVERGLAKDLEDAHNVLARFHPIGRMGLPEDIAAAVNFLASDDAGFMTGSELVVDGGYTAQ